MRFVETNLMETLRDAASPLFTYDIKKHTTYCHSGHIFITDIHAVGLWR
jgi:hypothetical protein